MKDRNNILKVATDMSIMHLKWATWGLSLTLIAYIILSKIDGTIVMNGQKINEQIFLTFALQPAKTGLFIIGIISVSSFLSFYVKQGVTRKDYFYGHAISSIIVPFVLMVFAGIISFFEQLLIPTKEIDSFLGPDSSWLLVVSVYSLSILVYYLAGSLIGAGFFKYGAGGLLYIVFAIILVSVVDMLWDYKLENLFFDTYSVSNPMELPLFLSYIGTIGLLAITLWIIRITTKRVSIKIK
jgi:hypothetical protein